MYIRKCRICKNPMPEHLQDTWEAFCSITCGELHNQNLKEKELGRPFVHYCPKCNYPRGYVREKAYKTAVEKGKLCDKCDGVEWIARTRPKTFINDKACQFMDELNKRGFHFQHGKNGGEYYTGACGPCGYFLDGYDPINYIVFEYDEPSHFQQWEKDRRREHDIFQYFKNQKIFIRFIRYCEFSGKLYEVFDNRYDKHGMELTHKHDNN